MNFETIVGVLLFIVIAVAITMAIEKFVVPLFPDHVKKNLRDDVVTRLVVFGTVLGLVMLKHKVLSIIAIWGAFVCYLVIKNALKMPKGTSVNPAKNTLENAVLPINSNEVEEQVIAANNAKVLEAEPELKNNVMEEASVVNNAEVDAESLSEEQLKNNAPNKVEVEGKNNALEPVQNNLVSNQNTDQAYNSELALGETLYLPNNELQKQNKAKVSRNTLESRFAIYLEGSEQFKHNETSYARNDSKYVTGELLECGLPNDTDKCVTVQEMKDQEAKEGFVNLPRRYFNNSPKSCGGSFTSSGQFKDVQSNLVDCGCDGKQDTKVTCLNKETNALYSAKRQYSSQGTSNNPMNPSGFNL